MSSIGATIEELQFIHEVENDPKLSEHITGKRIAIEPVDGKIFDIEIAKIQSFRLDKIIGREGIGEYLCKVRMNDKAAQKIKIDYNTYKGFLDYLPKEKIIEKVSPYTKIEPIIQGKVDPVDGKIGGLELAAIHTFRLKKSLYFEDGFFCVVDINGKAEKFVMSSNYFMAFISNLPKEKLDEYALEQSRIVESLAECDLKKCELLQRKIVDQTVECHLTMDDETKKVIKMDRKAARAFLLQVPESIQGGDVEDYPSFLGINVDIQKLIALGGGDVKITKSMIESCIEDSKRDS